MKSPRTVSLLIGHGVTLAALLLTGPMASAANRNWQTAGGGVWNTSSNWSGGTPTISDAAIFNIQMTGDVTLSGAGTAQKIQFDTNAGNSVTNNLIIGATDGPAITIAYSNDITVLSSLLGTGKTFTVNAPIIINPLNATGPGAFSLVNHATSSTNVLVVGGGISSGTTSATTALTLQGTNTGNNEVSGNISNGTATTFSVTKSNLGTWILSGNNTYNGATTVTQGVLVLKSANAISGGIGSTGGTSNLIFNSTVSANSIGVVSAGVVGLGAGDFTRSLGTGADQVQFTGHGGFAAFGEDRVVNLGGSGAMVTWASGSFVAASRSLILGAANADKTVDFQNAIDFAGSQRTVQADDGAAAIDAILSGVLSNGSLKKVGTGTLQVSGTNTYTAQTSVNGGLLNFTSLTNSGVASSVGTNGTIGLDGGGLQYTGSTAQSTNRTISIGNGGATIDASGTGSGVLNFTSTGSTSGGGSSRTFTLTGTNAGANTFATKIINPSGAMTSLVKSGTGKWVLTGASTYTGTTAVNAGTLLINADNSSATGAVSVASGATLGGTGKLGGAVTVDGIIAPGDGMGTLQANSGLIWNGAAVAGAETNWKFELGASNASDLLNIVGDFTKGTGAVFRFDLLGSTAVGTFKLVDWSGTTSFSETDFSYTNLGAGNTGSFAFNGTQLELTVVAVPEPATWVLLATGLLAVFVFRRSPARRSND